MEMSRLAKDQILSQSGISMVAQANLLPQHVLRLLPGATA